MRSMLCPSCRVCPCLHIAIVNVSDSPEFGSAAAICSLRCAKVAFQPLHQNLYLSSRCPLNSDQTTYHAILGRDQGPLQRGSRVSLLCARFLERHRSAN